MLGYFICRSRHGSEDGSLLKDAFNQRRHQDHCVDAGTVNQQIHNDLTRHIVSVYMCIYGIFILF